MSQMELVVLLACSPFVFSLIATLPVLRDSFPGDLRTGAAISMLKDRKSRTQIALMSAWAGLEDYVGFALLYILLILVCRGLTDWEPEYNGAGLALAVVLLQGVLLLTSWMQPLPSKIRSLRTPNRTSLLYAARGWIADDLVDETIIHDPRGAVEAVAAGDEAVTGFFHDLGRGYPSIQRRARRDRVAGLLEEDNHRFARVVYEEATGSLGEVPDGERDLQLAIVATWAYLSIPDALDDRRLVDVVNDSKLLERINRHFDVEQLLRHVGEGVLRQLSAEQLDVTSLLLSGRSELALARPIEDILEAQLHPPSFPRYWLAYYDESAKRMVYGTSHLGSTYLSLAKESDFACGLWLHDLTCSPGRYTTQEVYEMFSEIPETLEKALLLLTDSKSDRAAELGLGFISSRTEEYLERDARAADPTIESYRLSPPEKRWETVTQFEYHPSYDPWRFRDEVRKRISGLLLSTEGFDKSNLLNVLTTAIEEAG